MKVPPPLVVFGTLIAVATLSGCRPSSAPTTSPLAPASVPSTSTPTPIGGDSDVTSTPGNGSTSPLDEADIIYYDGDVITLEHEGVVQAIAIRGDTILAVGSNDEVLNLQGSATAVIDLQGRTLMPGFVEGHSHILDAALKNGLTLDEAQQVALGFGWTTLSELGLSSNEGFGEIMQGQQSDELRIRVNGFYKYNRSRVDDDGNNEVIESFWLDQAPLLANDRLFRIVGIKIYVDGSLVLQPGRGCYAVAEPYPEAFQQSDYFRDVCLGLENGSIYLPQDQLNAVVAEAQEAGYRVALHANGDRAIDMALTAIEKALDGASNELYRHQIHHNVLLSPGQISRYQESEVLATIRGTFPSCSPIPWAGIFGESRAEYAANRYALPSLIDHAFAEGDFGWQYDPYNEVRRNPIDPLQNLWGFVTRKDIDDDGSFCEAPQWVTQHEITVEQGLRLLTIASAYAASQEDVLGTLKVGKFADIVILDRNPLSVSSDEILDLSVLMTMVGGNAEFCQEGNEALCPET